jgi:tape measure domain-containing protein
MAVDLGDVTIGLRVNTEGLIAASEQLRKFGQLVDKWSRSKTESDQQAARVLAQQEKALSSLMTRISQVAVRQQEIGASSGSVDKLTNAYNDLADVLTKGRVPAQHLSRAIEAGKRALLEANNELRRHSQEQTAVANKTAALTDAYTKLLTTTRAISGTKLAPDTQLSVLKEALRAYDQYRSAVEESGGSVNKLKVAQKQFAMGMAEVKAMLGDENRALTQQNSQIKQITDSVVNLTNAESKLIKAKAAPGRSRATGTEAETQYITAINKAYDTYNQRIATAEGNQRRMREANARFGRDLAKATTELQNASAATRSMTDAETAATRVSTALAAAQNSVAVATANVARSKIAGTAAESTYLQRVTTSLQTFKQVVSQAGNDSNVLKRAQMDLTTALVSARIEMQKEIDTMNSAATARKNMTNATVALSSAQSKATSVGLLAGKGASAGTQAEADHLQRVTQLFRSYVSAATAARNDKEAFRIATANFNRGLTDSIAVLQADTNALKSNAQAAKDAALSQALLINAQAKVRGLDLGAERLRGGNAAQYIEANRVALNNYGAALAAAQGSTHRYTLAKAELNRHLVENRKLLVGAESAGSGLVGMFRRMEEAAVLSFGPLSGVGARLNIIASMMEQMPFKTFAFLAGVTALATGMAVLAKSSVQATISFERWEAQMLVATGTMITVGTTMERVINFANQFGQSLEQVIPAYSKFAASARLAGVSLADQTLLFEGAIKAAAALRLPEEGIQRIFLAFEQMAAKGTVATEEIKRQLGDVIPGAVELGAKAMGMSIGNFMKALKDQEIKFSEFAPKFGKLWNEIFGEAAARGAQSTQAAMVKLGNTWLIFNRKLDETIRFSTLFKAVLGEVTKFLNNLTNNLNETIAKFAAWAAAIGTLLGIMTAYRLVVWAIASATMFWRTAQIGLNAALATGNVLALLGPYGKLAAVLVSIAVAAGIAKHEYAAFLRLTGTPEEAQSNRVSQIEESVKILQKTGKILKDTSVSSLADIDAVIADVKNKYEVASLVVFRGNVRLDELRKQMAEGKTPAIKDNGYAGLKAAQDEVKFLEETIASANASMPGYQQLLDRLGKARDELNKIPIEQIDLSKTLDDKGTKAFHDKIQAIIDDMLTAKQSFDLMKQGGSPEEMRWLDALNKAGDIFNKMPDKFSKARLTEMLKPYALANEGVVFTLARMLHATKEQNRAEQERTRFIDDFDNRVSQVNDTLETYADRADEANTVTSEWARMVVQADKEIRALGKRAERVWDGSGESKEFIDAYVKYVEDKARELQDVSFAAYWRKEMENVDAVLGNEIPKIKEKFDRLIEIANMAALFGKLDPMEAAQKIGMLMNLMKRAMEQSKLKEYFADLQGAVKNWEDQTVEAIMTMVTTGKSQFKELFNSIANDITKLIVKRQIVEPIYNTLFGGLANENIGGTGVLGGLLMKLFPPTERMKGAQGKATGGAFEANYPDLATPPFFQEKGNSLLEGMSKMFTNISDYFKPAWKDMQDVFSGMGDYFKPLLSGLGDIFTWFISAFSATAATSGGGGGAGGMFGSILGAIGESAAWEEFGNMVIGLVGMHSGGIVGKNASFSGYASASMFAGAPKYARGGLVGLQAGERPIIAHDGEEVLTKNDPRHRNNGGGSKVFNITVNVPQGTNQASAKQIGAAVARNLMLVNERFN